MKQTRENRVAHMCKTGKWPDHPEAKMIDEIPPYIPYQHRTTPICCGEPCRRNQNRGALTNALDDNGYRDEDNWIYVCRYCGANPY